MRATSLVLILVGLTACTTVQPGYVGIEVDQWGGNKGVQDYPIRTGRVTYNPITTSIYEYPTFVQTAKWTASAHEGSEHDQSLNFSSKEGSQFNVDLGLSYSFVAEKVPHVFVKYRQQPEHILDNIIRNTVREELNRFAGEMPALGIVGPLKQQLVDSVTAALRTRLEPDGIHIEMVSLLSTPRPLDPKVQESIDQAVAATNNAIRAENNVRTATAEAEQARARGKGQGDSIFAVAEAQAKANERLAASITGNLIEYKKLEKWNGVVPMFSGGGTVPVVTIAPRP